MTITRMQSDDSFQRPDRARTMGWIHLVSLVAVYLALGVGYQNGLPLFEGPDEPSHIEVIGFISTHGRPPYFDAQPEVLGEGMQPPLFYGLVAPLFRAVVKDEGLAQDLHHISAGLYGGDPNAFRRSERIRFKPSGGRLFDAHPELAYLNPLRLPSLAFGCLAVVLTFVAARRAFQSVSLATASAALLAFNPQFLFVSSYVSNDSSAAAVGAAGLWLIAVSLNDTSRRHYLALSLLCVVGFLVKLSTLPALAVTALVIFAIDARPLARKLPDAALAAALLALLIAPQLVWNTAHRGGPLGTGATMASAEHLRRIEDSGGLLVYLIYGYPRLVFESYWGRFGWMSVPAPHRYYWGMLALTVLGLVGFVRGDSHDRSRVFRRCIALAASACLGAHIVLNTQVPAGQGRHLFPVAPHVACILAWGLLRLCGGPNRTAGRVAALGIPIAMALLSLYALTKILVPAYA